MNTATKLAVHRVQRSTAFIGDTAFAFAVPLCIQLARSAYFICFVEGNRGNTACIDFGLHMSKKLFFLSLSRDFFYF